MNLRVALEPNREFEKKLEVETLTLGVIGLGYVGLPLVHVFWQSGLRVVGFDIDPGKIVKLAAGETYINHFAPGRIVEMNESDGSMPRTISDSCASAMPS